MCYDPLRFSLDWTSYFFGLVTRLSNVLVAHHSQRIDCSSTLSLDEDFPNSRSTVQCPCGHSPISSRQPFQAPTCVLKACLGRQNFSNELWVHRHCRSTKRVRRLVACERQWWCNRTKQVASGDTACVLAHMPGMLQDVNAMH